MRSDWNFFEKIYNEKVWKRAKNNKQYKFMLIIIFRCKAKWNSMEDIKTSKALEIQDQEKIFPWKILRTTLNQVSDAVELNAEKYLIL